MEVHLSESVEANGTTENRANSAGSLTMPDGSQTNVTEPNTKNHIQHKPNFDPQKLLARNIVSKPRHGTKLAITNNVSNSLPKMENNASNLPWADDDAESESSVTPPNSSLSSFHAPNEQSKGKSGNNNAANVSRANNTNRTNVNQLLDLAQSGQQVPAPGNRGGGSLLGNVAIGSNDVNAPFARRLLDDNVPGGPNAPADQMLPELRSKATSSLKNRLRRETARNWTLGTLATYTLGVVAVGGVLAGVTKGAFLVGIFAAAGGPVGAVIGIAVTLALIETGALVGTGGWKFGEWLGEKRAEKLRPNDPFVAVEADRVIDAGLKNRKVPQRFGETFEAAYGDAIRELDQGAAPLTLEDRKAIRAATYDHLLDQLRCFKSGYSLNQADVSLRHFAKSMGTELHATKLVAQWNSDPQEANQNCIGDAAELLTLLAQSNPPAARGEVHTALRATLHSWNRYQRQANLAGLPDTERQTLSEILSSASLRRSETESVDDDSEIGQVLQPLGDAAQPHAARSLCINLEKMKKELPSADDSTADNAMAKACQQQHELLSLAMQQLAERDDKTQVHDEFEALGKGKGWTAAELSRELDQDVVRETANLAVQHAVLRYVDSLAA